MKRVSPIGTSFGPNNVTVERLACTKDTKTWTEVLQQHHVCQLSIKHEKSSAPQILVFEPEKKLWTKKSQMQKISNFSSWSSSCLFLFTVETLSQPVPKSSCDFVWRPQLTMLPLKNSSLNKATLASVHQSRTQTPALLHFLWTHLSLTPSTLVQTASGGETSNS